MEYKQITQEELEEILKEHKLWLESEGTEGKKANLKYANLRYANLKYANLRYANLEDASLEYANLEDANLEGANLRYANLRYANLSFANLRFADLRYANLRNAYLKNADLEGANVESANLRYTNVDFVEGFYTIGNIGTFKGNIIYCVSNNTVYAGCWEGNLEYFLERGLKMNRHHVDKENIRLAYTFFKNNSRGEK